MRLILLAFSIALASCGSLPRGVDDFQDRRLATIPDGVDLLPPAAFSQDGRHVAYMAQFPDGCRAVREAWTSRLLDSL